MPSREAPHLCGSPGPEGNAQSALGILLWGGSNPLGAANSALVPGFGTQLWPGSQEATFQGLALGLTVTLGLSFLTDPRFPHLT